MKIGMFGGSFNPPTKAHMYLAKETIKKYNLDKLVFVPVSNRYNKKDLADEKHRYNMLDLLCSKYEKIDVSDIEFSIKENLSAIDIFKILSEKYKKDELYFIIGMDNLEKIHTWKDWETLISSYKFIVLERGNVLVKDFVKNSLLLKNYKININSIKNQKKVDCSATYIRENIENWEKVKNYISKKIYKYIKENNIY